MNGIPSPLKNLFWNSTQCNLSACRKHSIVSIIMITPSVTIEKNANPNTMWMNETTMLGASAMAPPKIMFKKTLDN